MSHGQLLIRSSKTKDRPTQIDILFKNVAAICIPTMFDGISIVSNAVPEGLPRFDVLTSSGSGYIVAGAVVVDESDLDYHNASPLLNR
ncbi:hypothetical protein AB4059_00575 [Lysobacter sp. 2RAF19]